MSNPTHLKPDAAASLGTPALSPSTSANASPAFSTILESPSLEPLDLDNASQWRMPECWGHRGASATYPENTRASFVEACKQGADGIETDIHITADNVLVLFHDPKLDRTTTGTGRIREQPWKGVLEHVRTREEPVQPIPLFSEVLDILLLPENAHVKLNLDCKVDNDAVKLFTLVRDVIQGFPNWQTTLAPRVVLGLWHPKFLQPASTLLPYLPRYAISMSLPQSRRYFWDTVHGFSVYYEALATADGQRFLAECHAAGKGVCAWTVNGREEMRECARWGVRSIITDKPALWRGIKQQASGIIADRNKALRPTLQTYILPWVSRKNYWFDVANEARKETEYLEKEGGRFDDVEIPELSLDVARVANAKANANVSNVL
ncbi:hypothetical protein EHS25_000523 [Saitozyma podzolica]|uniref:GP-PDE domain-containing protein n=1 Tax=Saitozyma podzolica TaxID=1890683 RepID=A0A427YWC1_9TREE|nr:hypothetical protein EHS25_000523 [Saitozyma podzolica]